MKRVLWMAALLIWTTLTAHACLWDSDTLKDEAKGLPDVIQIITGRFERNPPLYYSIRLDRVAAALKFSPKSLELYDDAGVACDRLGHDEEAIQWMAKKRAILDGMPADDPNAREHRYRYFANIGTFRIHRWIRAGADRRNLQEAKQARAEINEALALNPNAHFGREAYQAQVIGWIIDEPRSTRHQAHSNDSGEKSEAATFAEILIARKGDSDEAVKGLAGLIALGSAWESTDVFSALSSLLNAKGKSVVAYLAQLRCEDAETWSAKRTDYMLVRLKAGRHPDTDANFWSGYHETEPPSHDPSLDERAIILSQSGKVAGRTCNGGSRSPLTCVAPNHVPQIQTKSPPSFLSTTLSNPSLCKKAERNHGREKSMRMSTAGEIWEARRSSLRRASIRAFIQDHYPGFSTPALFPSEHCNPTSALCAVGSL